MSFWRRYPLSRRYSAAKTSRHRSPRRYRWHAGLHWLFRNCHGNNASINPLHQSCSDSGPWKRPLRGRQKQKQLKQSLLADIDEVSDFMQVRSYRSKPEPLILIYIAAFGVLVSSILFSVYRPDRITITFFTLYNSFVAIVLYFIIMMNNPLLGPFKIQNEPFRMIMELANM